jgi:hypothetical protein
MKNKTKLQVGMSGQYTVNVVDSATGKIRYTASDHNMIVDNAFNTILNSAGGSLRSNTTSRLFNGLSLYCYVGANSAATTANMTEFSTSPIASVTVDTGNAASVNSNPSTDITDIYAQRYFKFNPGSIVDETINEIGIGNVSTGADYLHARIVLGTPIFVTATDELQVTWKITYNFPITAGFATWSGTVLNSQPAGDTDIDWILTMSSTQVTTFLSAALSDTIFTTSSVTPDMILGDSNSASTGTGGRLGTQLYSGNGVTSAKVANYNPATFTRDISVLFEHDAPEAVNIGEYLIHNNPGVGRVTFNPLISKPATYRLALSYSITLSRV